jgi:uncharacterized membrane protein YraQ (UPF0718 family)
MVVETKTFRRDRLDLRDAFLDRSVLVLAAVALVSGVACWQLAGMDAVIESIEADFWLYVDLAPKMAVAFFVAALVTSLVPRQTIARWLGRQSGMKGVTLATAAGAVTPGGPMMSFPLVASLAKAGAGRPALIAYITSWETLGFQRIIIWDIPLLGVEYTLMRFVASLPLPFIAAFITLRLPGWDDPSLVAQAQGERKDADGKPEAEKASAKEETKAP